MEELDYQDVINSYKPTDEQSLLNDGLDDKPLYFICPFCGGEDYDLIGLKVHYQNGWCDEFNDLETVRRGGA